MKTHRAKPSFLRENPEHPSGWVWLLISLCLMVAGSEHWRALGCHESMLLLVGVGGKCPTLAEQADWFSSQSLVRALPEHSRRWPSWGRDLLQLVLRHL